MPYPSTSTLPGPNLFPGSPLVDLPPRPGRWTLVAEYEGEEIGEIRGSQRSVTPKPLKGLGSATGRVRSNDPIVPYLAEGEKCLVKAYEEQLDRVQKLQYVGPVTDFRGEWGSEDGAVTFVSTSGGWWLEGRHVGRTRTGFKRGTATAQVDRGEIMGQGLDEVNVVAPTGVRRGTITLSDETYMLEPVYFKPLLELWDDMAGPLEGPDWQLIAIEPSANGGDMCAVNIAPVIGAPKPDAVWEYGSGSRANVKGWSWVIDPKTVANRAYHIPTGFPDNTSDAPVVASDQPSINDRRLREAVLALDISAPTLRQQLVDEHVAVRKVPRQVIAFEPAMEVAGDLRYGRDYNEGDAIAFQAVEQYPVHDDSLMRVVDQQEVAIVDVSLRLRAVTFGLNENGDPTPVFVLTGDEASS